MKSIFKYSLLLLGFLFCNPVTSQETPVKWKLSTKKLSPCEYELIFTGTIDEHWHVYSLSLSGDDGPMPSKITVNPSPQYEVVGKAREGKAIKGFDKVFEMDVAYFEKEVVFKQKIKLKTDKNIKISGNYEYQACTEEKCIFPPAEDFSFDLEGSGDCLITDKTTGKVESQECVCDTSLIVSNAQKLESLKNKEILASNISTISATPPLAAVEECNPWKTLFLGLSFGLGAVLMPCIYSLIPLTVSFFLKQNKTKSSAIRSSFLYGFFITFIFVALTMGITLIFGPAALSNIATNTWLNLFFFLLFIVFALSFFGLFEITLPSSWANRMDARADQGGTLGIFFMALTLVIVSFSCTVGFMGSLLTAVSSGESYLCPLMGFTGFGAGIAMPFMLFAMFPSWLRSLPKSGGWMTTFKVTIAFLELALAVKFLTNADNVNEWGIMTREVFIASWIGIFAMLTFYLLGVFRTAHDDPKGHLSIGRIMWSTFFLSFTLYLIPGLWGAPLKLISSFPPPHYYAESPDGLGGHASVSNAASKGDPELVALENLRVTGPDGLRLFKDDYDSALKYARLVKKPLFIDFTGKACVNCRLMESNVWVKPEVMPMLRDSVVIVSLYVDSKVPLPAEEQKEVFWYNKNRILNTIGDKWAYFQTTKYKSSSQPLYVLIHHDESTATAGTIGTELDEKKFGAWLRGGINNFLHK